MHLRTPGHFPVPSRAAAHALLALAALSQMSCTGPQSALAPAGEGAAEMASLFWWMLAGSAVVWALVVGLGWFAVRRQPLEGRPQAARRYIIGGGVIFPTVVLTVLLAHGLSSMPRLLAPPPPGSLEVAVRGEQWWWRIEYRPPGGDAVTLANEIRLPVGQPVQFILDAPDVIHSFWIPSLGGKMDMIPGRTNRLTLYPTRTGTFRGVCAEYCGTSHAWMAFPVVVMEPEAFARWLDAQRAPAAPPPADTAIDRGARSFLANGCGACHAVRGTPADGQVGPDLTHVGGRLSLGAGVLGNERPDFVRWLADTGTVKPGVLMPHFSHLPAEELEALAAYLDSLQ